MESAVNALWQEVWRGSLSADTWEPMRRAAIFGITPKESRLMDAGMAEAAAPAGYGRRGASRLPRAVRERWKAGPPVRGNWFSIAGDPNPEAAGILEEEELNKDRVRLLLKRWGILCRPLLEREAPCLSWSRLLPSMRRMELAGELTAGRFFGGINSLQFASPRIAEELEEAEAERGIYWMNAADAASPAGLDAEDIFGIKEMQAGLLRRVASTRLCFRGADLLAVSVKGGKELEIFIGPDDPEIAAALAFIKLPRTRAVQPENKITVEKINGKTAAGSPYCSALTALGFIKDRGKMILW
jgi:ATP-dependent Lhr-like helicase